MALAGNIQEFGLADIFQIVSLQQKTGELAIKGKEGVVTVLVDRGLIVGANASFRPLEERLERALIRSESINKFQMKRALETQKKTLQPLWTVLAETKAINIDTLKSRLSQQIHETVYHVLRWTEGEYRFVPKKVEYDKHLISPINTEFLVMEGFRITDEWSQVENVITSFQMRVRRNPSAPDSPDGLSSPEAKVFSILEKERTVQDVIDIGQIGEFDTCQIIYDLIKKNLVERTPTKKGKAPQVRRASIGIVDILAKTLTVLVVVALLGGIVFALRFIPENLSLVHLPNFKGVDEVKRLSALAQLQNLASGISLYYFEQHALPASLEDLVEEGIIEADRFLSDPWGQPYQVLADKKQVTLVSSGSDGQSGTDNDLRLTLTF